MPTDNSIQEPLAILARGGQLTQDQSFAAFGAIMAGQATGAQIGALLGLLAARPGGPDVGEITGAALAMRSCVVPVQVPPGLDVLDIVDTCGTGGDSTGTFNISTAAAIVAAGAGVPVAKHGNRSVTSASGSSQVLEALGVRLEVSPEVQARCLREAGLCFCFAPAHHPAMKHAAGPRRELGFRTIFNILGPLANPAGARRQVVGVYDPALTRTMAEVLQRLGSLRALVVHGDGLDEISTTGPTLLASLENGKIETFQVHPKDLGLKSCSRAELQVKGVEESAALIRQVLAGQKGPATDIVALNASAALVVAGKAADLRAGLALAFQSLDSGAAAKALEKLVQITSGA